MPVYDYLCNNCNTKYEVYHKTLKEETKIICPSCNSTNSKKLISAANVGGFSREKTCEYAGTSACSSGMCGLQ
jgi:putative FmdB family regulatory protein